MLTLPISNNAPSTRIAIFVRQPERPASPPSSKTPCAPDLASHDEEAPRVIPGHIVKGVASQRRADGNYAIENRQRRFQALRRLLMHMGEPLHGAPMIERHALPQLARTVEQPRSVGGNTVENLWVSHRGNHPLRAQARRHFFLSRRRRTRRSRPARASAPYPTRRLAP